MEVQQGEWWELDGYQYFIGPEARRYSLIWNDEVLDIIIPDGAAVVIGLFRGIDCNLLINEPTQVHEILEAINRNSQQPTRRVVETRNFH